MHQLPGGLTGLFHWHFVIQMINLATEYFGELMSNGNVEVCARLLSPDVEHKDMVGERCCP